MLLPFLSLSLDNIFVIVSISRRTVLVVCLQKAIAFKCLYSGYKNTVFSISIFQNNFDLNMTQRAFVDYAG